MHYFSCQITNCRSRYNKLKNRKQILTNIWKLKRYFKAPSEISLTHFGLHGTVAVCMRGMFIGSIHYPRGRRCQILFEVMRSPNFWVATLSHRLGTPNEGINQRNMKIWADVADKIFFRPYLKIWE